MVAIFSKHSFSRQSNADNVARWLFGLRRKNKRREAELWLWRLACPNIHKHRIQQAQVTQVTQDNRGNRRQHNTQHVFQISINTRQVAAAEKLNTAAGHKSPSGNKSEICQNLWNLVEERQAPKLSQALIEFLIRLSWKITRLLKSVWKKRVDVVFLEMPVKTSIIDPAPSKFSWHQVWPNSPKQFKNIQQLVKSHLSTTINLCQCSLFWLLQRCWLSEGLNERTREDISLAPLS